MRRREHAGRLRVGSAEHMHPEVHSISGQLRVLLLLVLQIISKWLDWALANRLFSGFRAPGPGPGPGSGVRVRVPGPVKKNIKQSF